MNNNSDKTIVGIWNPNTGVFVAPTDGCFDRISPTEEADFTHRELALIERAARDISALRGKHYSPEELLLINEDGHKWNLECAERDLAVNPTD